MSSFLPTFLSFKSTTPPFNSPPQSAPLNPSQSLENASSEQVMFNFTEGDEPCPDLTGSIHDQFFHDAIEKLLSDDTTKSNQSHWTIIEEEKEEGAQEIKISHPDEMGFEVSTGQAEIEGMGFDMLASLTDIGVGPLTDEFYSLNAGYLLSEPYSIKEDFYASRSVQLNTKNETISPFTMIHSLIVNQLYPENWIDKDQTQKDFHRGWGMNEFISVDDKIIKGTKFSSANDFMGHIESYFPSMNPEVKLGDILWNWVGTQQNFFPLINNYYTDHTTQKTIEMMDVEATVNYQHQYGLIIDTGKEGFISLIMFYHFVFMKKLEHTGEDDETLYGFSCFQRVLPLSLFGTFHAIQKKEEFKNNLESKLINQGKVLRLKKGHGEKYREKLAKIETDKIFKIESLESDVDEAYGRKLVSVTNRSFDFIWTELLKNSPWRTPFLKTSVNQ